MVNILVLMMPHNLPAGDSDTTYSAYPQYNPVLLARQFLKFHIFGILTLALVAHLYPNTLVIACHNKDRPITRRFFALIPLTQTALLSS